MRHGITKLFAATFIFSGGMICTSRTVRAQSPPGPIRPSGPVTDGSPSPRSRDEKPKIARKPREPRDFSGSWSLNRDESDDPRKKMEDARQNGGYGGGGRRSGGSYPGGGGYPRGGGNRGGMGGRQNDDDHQRMQEVFPANSLTIAQKEPEIDLTDDRGRRQTFFTDGRKVQKAKNAPQQEFSAKWDDNRLVAEEKLSNGSKITRTFELAESGNYLYETVRVEGGRASSGMYFRYLYDPKPDDKK